MQYTPKLPHEGTENVDYLTRLSSSLVEGCPWGHELPGTSEQPSVGEALRQRIRETQVLDMGPVSGHRNCLPTVGKLRSG